MTRLYRNRAGVEMVPVGNLDLLRARWYRQIMWKDTATVVLLAGLGLVEPGCGKSTSDGACSCKPITDDLKGAGARETIQKIAADKFVHLGGCKGDWETRCGKAALKQVLKRGHYTLKIEAALAALDRGWKDLAPRVVPMLESEHYTVRVAAIKALIRLDPNTLRKRLPKLVHDPRREVAEVLFRLVKGKPSLSVPVYLTLLNTETDSEKAYYLKKKLYKLQAGGPIRALLKKKVKVRKGLINVLALLRDTDGLILALSSPHHATRLAALEEIERLQDPRTLPVLIKGLSDDHDGVREYAALALAKFDHKDARAALQRAAKTEKDKGLRSRIQELIKRRRRTKAPR